ncbi:uncharacterized protein MYCFIDRAFT_180679 [Pseudocercospora fijiensis CIRAD86]|uniref:Uncharacterized protein n=1 Tax=Pseudocercospora fijiensis (strain CIRAD86) TaxID=383855 RepID=M3AHV8_PSEFD|nr:uncharacterized protein MYCFIDRAFT_180679 [Pseudocercospora fijiensis CIRAD86]EME76778.1 hypothetical protein MYCFIDRAFT_180679 [Pseudocercospora fijiensis CIRAD86]
MRDSLISLPASWSGVLCLYWTFCRLGLFSPSKVQPPRQFSYSDDHSARLQHPPNSNKLEHTLPTSPHHESPFPSTTDNAMDLTPQAIIHLPSEPDDVDTPEDGFLTSPHHDSPLLLMTGNAMNLMPQAERPISSAPHDVDTPEYSSPTPRHYDLPYPSFTDNAPGDIDTPNRSSPTSLHQNSPTPSITDNAVDLTPQADSRCPPSMTISTWKIKSIKEIMKNPKPSPPKKRKLPLCQKHLSRAPLMGFRELDGVTSTVRTVYGVKNAFDVASLWMSPAPASLAAHVNATTRRSSPAGSAYVRDLRSGVTGLHRRETPPDLSDGVQQVYQTSSSVASVERAARLSSLVITSWSHSGPAIHQQRQWSEYSILTSASPTALQLRLDMDDVQDEKESKKIPATIAPTRNCDHTKPKSKGRAGMGKRRKLDAIETDLSNPTTGDATIAEPCAQLPRGSMEIVTPPPGDFLLIKDGECSFPRNGCNSRFPSSRMSRDEAHRHASAKSPSKEPGCRFSASGRGSVLGDMGVDVARKTFMDSPTPTTREQQKRVCYAGDVIKMFAGGDFGGDVRKGNNVPGDREEADQMALAFRHLPIFDAIKQKHFPQSMSTGYLILIDIVLDLVQRQAGADVAIPLLYIFLSVDTSHLTSPHLPGFVVIQLTVTWWLRHPVATSRRLATAAGITLVDQVSIRKLKYSSQCSRFSRCYGRKNACLILPQQPSHLIKYPEIQILIPQPLYLIKYPEFQILIPVFSIPTMLRVLECSFYPAAACHSLGSHPERFFVTITSQCSATPTCPLILSTMAEKSPTSSFVPTPVVHVDGPSFLLPSLQSFLRVLSWTPAQPCLVQTNASRHHSKKCSSRNSIRAQCTPAAAMRVLCAVFHYDHKILHARQWEEEGNEESALLVLHSVLQLIDVARCTRHEEGWSGAEADDGVLIQIVGDLITAAETVLKEQQQDQAHVRWDEEEYAEAAGLLLRTRSSGLDRTLEVSSFTHVWMERLSRGFADFLVRIVSLSASSWFWKLIQVQTTRPSPLRTQTGGDELRHDVFTEDGSIYPPFAQFQSSSGCAHGACWRPSVKDDGRSNASQCLSIFARRMSSKSGSVGVTVNNAGDFRGMADGDSSRAMTSGTTTPELFLLQYRPTHEYQSLSKAPCFIEAEDLRRFCGRTFGTAKRSLFFHVFANVLLSIGLVAGTTSSVGADIFWRWAGALLYKGVYETVTQGDAALKLMESPRRLPSTGKPYIKACWTRCEGERSATGTMGDGRGNSVDTMAAEFPGGAEKMKSGHSPWHAGKWSDRTAFSSPLPSDFTTTCSPISADNHLQRHASGTDGYASATQPVSVPITAWRTPVAKGDTRTSIHLRMPALSPRLSAEHVYHDQYFLPSSLSLYTNHADFYCSCQYISSSILTALYTAARAPRRTPQNTQASNPTRPAIFRHLPMPPQPPLRTTDAFARLNTILQRLNHSPAKIAITRQVTYHATVALDNRTQELLASDELAPALKKHIRSKWSRGKKASEERTAKEALAREVAECLDIALTARKGRLGGRGGEDGNLNKSMTTPPRVARKRSAEEDHAESGGRSGEMGNLKKSTTTPPRLARKRSAEEDYAESGRRSGEMGTLKKITTTPPRLARKRSAEEDYAESGRRSGEMGTLKKITTTPPRLARKRSAEEDHTEPGEVREEESRGGARTSPAQKKRKTVAGVQEWDAGYQEREQRTAPRSRRNLHDRWEVLGIVYHNDCVSQWSIWHSRTAKTKSRMRAHRMRARLVTSIPNMRTILCEAMQALFSAASRRRGGNFFIHPPFSSTFSIHLFHLPFSSTFLHPPFWRLQSTVDSTPRGELIMLTILLDITGADLQGSIGKEQQHKHQQHLKQRIMSSALDILMIQLQHETAEMRLGYYSMVEDRFPHRQLDDYCESVMIKIEHKNAVLQAQMEQHARTVTNGAHISAMTNYTRLVIFNLTTSIGDVLPTMHCPAHSLVEIEQRTRDDSLEVGHHAELHSILGFLMNRKARIIICRRQRMAAVDFVCILLVNVCFLGCSASSYRSLVSFQKVRLTPGVLSYSGKNVRTSPVKLARVMKIIKEMFTPRPIDEDHPRDVHRSLRTRKLPTPTRQDRPDDRPPTYVTNFVRFKGGVMSLEIASAFDMARSCLIGSLSISLLVYAGNSHINEWQVSLCDTMSQSSFATGAPGHSMSRDRICHDSEHDLAILPLLWRLTTITRNRTTSAVDATRLKQGDPRSKKPRQLDNSLAILRNLSGFPTMTKSLHFAGTDDKVPPLPLKNISLASIQPVYIHARHDRFSTDVSDSTVLLPQSSMMAKITNPSRTRAWTTMTNRSNTSHLFISGSFLGSATWYSSTPQVILPLRLNHSAYTGAFPNDFRLTNCISCIGLCSGADGKYLQRLTPDQPAALLMDAISKVTSFSINIDSSIPLGQLTSSEILSISIIQAMGGPLLSLAPNLSQAIPMSRQTAIPSLMHFLADPAEPGNPYNSKAIHITSSYSPLRFPIPSRKPQSRIWNGIQMHIFCKRIRNEGYVVFQTTVHRDIGSHYDYDYETCSITARTPSHWLQGLLTHTLLNIKGHDYSAEQSNKRGCKTATPPSCIYTREKQVGRPVFYLYTRKSKLAARYLYKKQIGHPVLYHNKIKKQTSQTTSCRHELHPSKMHAVRMIRRHLTAALRTLDNLYRQHHSYSSEGRGAVRGKGKRGFFYLSK